METIKITTEEIENLKNIQIEGKQIMDEFGYVEYQIQRLLSKKNSLTSKLEIFEQKEKKLSLELQNKYGEGSIDLETGEFIKI